MRKHIFSTIALASFACAATFVFGQGGAGRAPQNGSGRGATSNSQQTSKGSARSTGRVASLAGTVWDYKMDSDDIEIGYEFSSGGKVTYGSQKIETGTWRQQGSRVVIDFGEGDVETGIITGNRMKGTRIEIMDGKKKTKRWSAKRRSDND